MPSFAGYGEVRAKSRVLEIASNTGLYLKKFQAHGCEVLGVEPARNIAELPSRPACGPWIDFFNSPNAAHIRNEWANRTSCWAGTCWRTLTIGSTCSRDWKKSRTLNPSSPSSAVSGGFLRANRI